MVSKWIPSSEFLALLQLFAVFIALLIHSAERTIRESILFRLGIAIFVVVLLIISYSFIIGAPPAFKAITTVLVSVVVVLAVMENFVQSPETVPTRYLKNFTQALVSYSSQKNLDESALKLMLLLEAAIVFVLLAVFRATYIELTETIHLEVFNLVASTNIIVILYIIFTAISTLGAYKSSNRDMPQSENMGASGWVDLLIGIFILAVFFGIIYPELQSVICPNLADGPFGNVWFC